MRAQALRYTNDSRSAPFFSDLVWLHSLSFSAGVPPHSPSQPTSILLKYWIPGHEAFIGPCSSWNNLFGFGISGWNISLLGPNCINWMHSGCGWVFGHGPPGAAPLPNANVWVRFYALHRRLLLKPEFKLLSVSGWGLFKLTRSFYFTALQLSPFPCHGDFYWPVSIVLLIRFCHPLNFLKEDEERNISNLVTGRRKKWF